MVLLINKVYFPPDKAAEVGKRYIEVLKKFPPDRSISKTLSIGVKATKNGIKVIGVAEVKKGKFEEAFTRLNQSDLEYADIEGYRYKVETIMDITEAMPTIGLQAPEDR